MGIISFLYLKFVSWQLPVVMSHWEALLLPIGQRRQAVRLDQTSAAWWGDLLFLSMGKDGCSYVMVVDPVGLGKVKHPLFFLESLLGLDHRER